MHSFSGHSSQIVVVGAGLAGLTAAFRLQDKGYDVHLFEARERPGGRVLSVKIGENYEELGGKNFNDGYPPIHSLNLFEELKLETVHSSTSLSLAYVNENEVIPFFDVLRKFNKFKGLWERMEQSAVQSQNLQEVLDDIFEDPDLHAFFTRTMRNYEGSDPKNLDPTSVDCLYSLFSLFYEMMQKAEAGEPSSYSWLTLKGGNAQLPLALAKRLKDKIYYKHALTSICQNGEDIILKFNHSFEVKANIVLLAIPCSVFSNINIENNLIPPTQLLWMKELQYGTSAKILFPHETVNTKYEAISSPDFISWPDFHKKIRTFYYGGQYGFFDQQNIHQIFEKGLTVIQRVYHNSTLAPLKFEAAQEIQLAQYEGGVFKCWALDPYAKGSYSNRAPGTVEWLNKTEIIQGENVRTAFKPAGDRIFFAGEHTTTLNTLGTMESAIESGERIARLIDKTLRNNKSSFVSTSV